MVNRALDKMESCRMQRTVSNLFLLCGIMILPWLVLGVYYTGSLTPGFDHVSQLMSELGARGSRTENISPIINNYPIGVLFIVFGVGVYLKSQSKKTKVLASALFIVHGMGSIFAGAFSCDIGCPLVGGSVDQNIHTLSGLVMFSSLCMACLMWCRPNFNLTESGVFGMFSLVCLVLASFFLLITTITLFLGEYTGLFERLSYGILCAWLLVLAISMVISRDVITGV
jgi:magnesium-transporting ATPase (P-type)